VHVAATRLLVFKSPHGVVPA